ncbi:hypothetical protein CEXT_218221 [Caerostris extrusa]|uniref:Uncharacterized protein n=1 Tax=Caerostris extrusa TaxID=172846 RepID=A0AAV4P9W3_CAEEX|nr:hypothetical protein CEXT_218221 [Caerostris extrusa]
MKGQGKRSPRIFLKGQSSRSLYCGNISVGRLKNYVSTIFLRAISSFHYVDTIAWDHGKVDRDLVGAEEFYMWACSTAKSLLCPKWAIATFPGWCHQKIQSYHTGIQKDPCIWLLSRQRRVHWDRSNETIRT